MTKEELIRLLNKHHTIGIVADKVGLSRQRIHQLIAKYNIPYDKKKAVKYYRHLKRNTEWDKKIVGLFKAGISVQEIMKIYNRRDSWVCSILRLHNVDVRAGSLKRTKKRNKELCDLYYIGKFRQIDLAKKYGLSQSQVSIIISHDKRAKEYHWDYAVRAVTVKKRAASRWGN